LDKSKNETDNNYDWSVKPNGLRERPADSGDFEAYVECTKCGWNTTYYPKDEKEPTACPKCHNN